MLYNLRVNRYTCKTSQQAFSYKLFKSIAILWKQSLAHKVTEVLTRSIIFATKPMCDPKQDGINTLKQWCLSDFTWIVKKRQKVKGQFTDLNLRQIPAYNLVDYLLTLCLETFLHSLWILKV